MPNLYATREAVKRAVRSNGSENDEAIDRLIEAASRDVDNMTHRWFIPRTQTRLFKWPGTYGLGDILWMDADLISVTTLKTRAQDSSPTTISSSDYFLEPVNNAPPYNRIEIDISSSASFESGDTSQRISVEGSWGFSADTVSVGTVASGLDSDATVTTMVASNGSLTSGVNVGDTLLIESEQVFVTEKTSAALASILLNGAITADKSENVTVDGGTHGINNGEIIQVDSEQMLVRSSTATVLTVERAYNGTTLAAHSNDVAVHIFRTLTITRGVNGTTGATHADATAVTAYRAPGPIRELTMAMAIAAFTQEAAAYGHTVGAAGGTVDVTGPDLPALTQRISDQYARPREYAI